MAATGGTKTIVTALIANSTIAIAKFFGFLITSSSAMLAEAVHSVADTSNQALLLLGKKRSENRLPCDNLAMGENDSSGPLLFLSYSSPLVRCTPFSKVLKRLGTRMKLNPYGGLLLFSYLLCAWKRMHSKLP